MLPVEDARGAIVKDDLSATAADHQVKPPVMGKNRACAARRLPCQAGGGGIEKEGVAGGDIFGQRIF